MYCREASRENEISVLFGASAIEHSLSAVSFFFYFAMREISNYQCFENCVNALVHKIGCVLVHN